MRRPNHGAALIVILVLDAAVAGAVLSAHAAFSFSGTTFAVLLIACGFVALGAIYWLLPQWQIPSSITGKERAELEDKARSTLGALIGSFALVATVGFTLLQLNETRKSQEDSLEATELGQLGERFSRAVEQLGSDSLDVRIGGLYSLERFAKTRLATFELTTADDRQIVGRVVSAYIREHAKRPKPGEERTLPEGAPCAEKPRAVSADVAAALDVLRTLFPADEELQLPRDTPELDLAGVDLSGADLSEIDLQFADLSDSLLVGTVFRHAWLDGANFAGADARGACFDDARLINTSFTAPLLPSAVPGEGSFATDPPARGLRSRAARLLGAVFTGSKLPGARLMYADLRCSDMTNADISGTYFEHADVRAVVPEGATPREAVANLVRAGIDRGGPAGTFPDTPERIRFCRPLVRR